MNDFQRLCLYALEDMTLVELRAKYFPKHGMGYIKKLITDDAKPLPFILENYIKLFDQKYHDRLAAYHKTQDSLKYGW